MLLMRLTFTKIACINLMRPSVILFACHFICKVTCEQHTKIYIKHVGMVHMSVKLRKTELYRIKESVYYSSDNLCMV